MFVRLSGKPSLTMENTLETLERSGWRVSLSFEFLSLRRGGGAAGRPGAARLGRLAKFALASCLLSPGAGAAPSVGLIVRQMGCASAAQGHGFF